MGCAAGAGVSSAAVGCTAELMMLHQQKTGGSLVEVAKTIIQRDGAHILLRGWVRFVELVLANRFHENYLSPDSFVL
jgi:hypothetical protein